MEGWDYATWKGLSPDLNLAGTLVLPFHPEKQVSVVYEPSGQWNIIVAARNGKDPQVIKKEQEIRVGSAVTLRVR